MGFASCEDYPDAFVLADGVPTVHYVRYADRDVLIEQAYMGEVVCFVGENLCSVHELLFNDQKAVLNTSFMTENTLMVAIPSNQAKVTTDKAYMITKGQDTLAIDFRVMMPAPVIKSMSCEQQPAGEEVTVYGNYFAEPIKIEFANTTVTDIKSLSMTEVTFVIPEGTERGRMKITTESGVSQSPFVYLDNRNILFDWDTKIGYGWRAGDKLVADDGADTFPGISGSYLKFGGKTLKGDIGGSWEEDNYCFNYWPDPDKGVPALSSLPEFAAMLEKNAVTALQVKFEMLIPAENPWSSCALQIMLTSEKTVSNQKAQNDYYSDTSVPRALYIPWLETGSFDTAGKWITVSVPLTECVKTHEGTACSESFSKDDLAGMTFFVWHGGVAGTDCDPVIAIDNIRIVPLK